MQTTETSDVPTADALLADAAPEIFRTAETIAHEKLQI